jgi:hypothetical protein
MQPDPVLKRSKQMPDMQVPGGSISGENSVILRMEEQVSFKFVAPLQGSLKRAIINFPARCQFAHFKFLDESYLPKQENCKGKKMEERLAIDPEN